LFAFVNERIEFLVQESAEVARGRGLHKVRPCKIAYRNENIVQNSQ
jgi:hypothetical protein